VEEEGREESPREVRIWKRVRQNVKKTQPAPVSFKDGESRAEVWLKR
jgi:hypothetical protein